MFFDLMDFYFCGLREFTLSICSKPNCGYKVIHVLLSLFFYKYIYICNISCLVETTEDNAVTEEQPTPPEDNVTEEQPTPSKDNVTEEQPSPSEDNTVTDEQPPSEKEEEGKVLHD